MMSDACGSIPEGPVPPVARAVQDAEHQRIQAAAQELSRQYQDLYAFSSIAYFLFDGGGRILEANLAGAALLREDRLALLDKSFEQFVAPPDQAAFREFCRQALVSWGKQVCQLTLLNGSLTVPVALEGFTPQVGTARGCLCQATAIDITDRQRVEQLNTLIQLSQTQLAETRLEGLLQRIVDAACQLTGARIGVAGPISADGAVEVRAATPVAAALRHSPDARTVMATGDLYAKAMQRGGLLRLTDRELRQHPGGPGSHVEHSTLRGVLGATLTGGNGQSQGLMLLSDKNNGGDFTADDEALLAQLAAIASLGLRHLAAQGDLESRANELAAVNQILRAESAARLQTEQTLDAQRRLLQLIVDHAAAGIAVFDPQLRVHWANPAYRLLLEEPYRSRDLTGCRLEDFVPGAEATGLADIFREVSRTGQAYRDSEYEYHGFARGTTYWRWSLVPLPAQPTPPHEIMLFAVEVTEQVRIRRKLEELASAAEAANVAKSQFLANVSHELRTPMNSILGMTELALRHRLPTRVRTYLQTGQDSAKMLLALLDELLDLSRIEAGKLALEYDPFDLRKTLDETLKLLAVRAWERDLELNYDLPLDVPDRLLGDPLRLRQILTNLVGNAIKFTSQGEVAVRIQVEAQTSDEVCLRFSVSDTGIGISEADRRKLFAPFAQADASATRRYGGTGLGLAIAANLTRLLGGRLWVESELGRGSTFFFTACFSLLRGAATPPRVEYPFVEQLRDLPVLVVDPNATRRQVLSDLLRGWSMRPELATDGAPALAQSLQAVRERRPFRLLIVNAQLPDRDGFTLVRELRKQQRQSTATILLLNPVERRVWSEACRRLRTAVFLEKPLVRTELLQAIGQACGWLSAAAADARTSPPPACQRSLRILLAEDNPANQDLAVYVLGDHGHRVQVAATGREALELVRQQDFDLVLMDIQMPIMDGFQATAAIRALPHPLRSQVPIVAMTAHATRDDEQRCLSCGMNGYLAKPVSSRTLIEIVERLAAREGPASTREDQERLPKRAAEQEVPAPVPGSAFDLSAALDFTDGHYDRFQQTVEFFFGDFPQLLDRIRASLHQQAAAEVVQAAHRLAGTLVYLAAAPALDAARRVEAAAEAGQLAQAATALQQLEQELETLGAALSPHRPPAQA